MLAALTNAEAMLILGVSERTIKNYRRYGLPQWAETIISLHTGNYPGWNGYLIRHGEIITPEGHKVTPNQVSHYVWLNDELGRLAERFETLNKKLNWYESISDSVNAESTSFKKLFAANN